MAADPPVQSLLILLGASRFSELPSLGEAQAAPLSGSADTVRRYFRERLGVRESLDLFDSAASASEQIKQMGVFLTGRGSGRLFIYYIGHGIPIAGAGSGSEFVLACRDTRQTAKLGTALTVAALAELLKSAASRLDVVMLLDCCFAAAAFSALQVSCRSLALFAATSRYKAAIAVPQANRTQFTDCLYRVLESGSAKHGERLSLDDLDALVRQKMQELYPDTAVMPELHAPKYGAVDPRREPLFPNPACRLEGRPEEPAEIPYLVIQLEPEKRRGPRPRYQVKAWMLIEAEPEQYWGDLIWDSDSGNDGKPLSEEQLDLVIPELHRGASDWLLANDIYRPDFWIEMIVPRELLNKRFDQIAGVNGPLGADHHMVVRSWERLRVAQSRAEAGGPKLQISLKPKPAGTRPAWELTADALLRQQRRWEELRRQEQQVCAPLLELPEAAAHAGTAAEARGAFIRAHCPPGRTLWDRLVSEHGLGVFCAVLEQPPVASSGQEDPFVTLLRAGIPIMLWVRTATGPKNSQAALRSVISAQEVRRIPEQVRALRRAAAIGAPEQQHGSELTLLWDNPNRLPGRIRLQAPGIRK